MISKRGFLKSTPFNRLKHFLHGSFMKGASDLDTNYLPNTLSVKKVATDMVNITVGSHSFQISKSICIYASLYVICNNITWWAPVQIIRDVALNTEFSTTRIPYINRNTYIINEMLIANPILFNVHFVVLSSRSEFYFFRSKLWRFMISYLFNSVSI